MPNSNDKQWGVMSGTGAGWGRYDTKEEAEQRRDEVARSHTDVVVVKVQP